ncbi:MAG: HEAT repeat domain-containing protein [Vicinamibacterales bacterium]
MLIFLLTSWRPSRSRFAVPLVVSILVVGCGAMAAAQPRAVEPAAPQRVTAEQLKAAIDRLGDLDYDTRTSASRVVRRTPGEQAVPALLQAVAEHADGYVRYRALVLLTGFNDPRTLDAMRESLRSPNDRLRTVAYRYFELNPNRDMVSELIAALDREQAEFVRPALVRALAAYGSDPRVQRLLVRDVARGEDFFRGAVIEALGDYRAAYALDAITQVARQDGPLQDDAAIALGRIGDRSSLEVLAGLQRTAPRERQPAVAAGICLLGVNCESHEGYLIETLKFSDRTAGFQELLRGAAMGLGALAVHGRPSAATALFTVGIPSRDPTRAPVALALATIALRNTPVLLPILDEQSDQAAALALVAEGFDMLEEDLEKERFFAFVRRTYWSAGDGSSTKVLMQTLIGSLDF